MGKMLVSRKKSRAYCQCPQASPIKCSSRNDAVTGIRKSKSREIDQRESIH